jgi:Xaa-Pro aminopeptidase
VDRPYKNRIAWIRDRLKQDQLDGLLVSIQENRRYLSGFTGEETQFDESAGVLLICAEHLILATDSRFTLQAQQEAPLFQLHQYEKGLVKELPELLNRLDIRRIGFESRRLSFFQHQEILQELEEKSVSVELVPLADFVEDLRLMKDPSEIDAVKTALHLAETAFRALCLDLHPAMTEKQIARALEAKIYEAGADGISFPTITASGPNSALPHAIPGDRKIVEGEPLLFDWGVRLNGYCSDISRTLVIGKPDSRFCKVYETVRVAQEKAIQAIKPGVTGKAVDAIARTHIENQGFGGKFGHGLGHGAGLAVHEGPRLSPLSTSVLEPGMVVTVEPGIYIQGWGGVRIENMVVVREDGAQILNSLDVSPDGSLTR